MSFAAPLWLGGAAALSLLVVALHLLARRQPKPLRFPTARFIPELPASAPAAARRPSDLLLLLLRVGVILLVGLGFARPQGFPPRRTASIVLLDVSRAAPVVLDDSLATLLGDAALVLAFDSMPRVWHPAAARDTAVQAAPGPLSAALLGAVRHAPALASAGDSLALHIISPFAAEEWDAATLAIRQLWHGGIVLHQITARAPATIAAGSAGLSDADPLAASLALNGAASLRGARVVRQSPAAADTVWARAGGALVYWPQSRIPVSWPTGLGDTVGGITSAGYAVAAPFVRVVRPPGGTVVARWPDGTPAATERPLGRGCQRDVAIPTDGAGDLMLRPSMLAITRELTAPCGGRRNLTPITAPQLDSLRGPPALHATSGLGRPATGRVPANGWFLAAALVLLAAEPLVRRSRR